MKPEQYFFSFWAKIFPLSVRIQTGLGMGVYFLGFRIPGAVINFFTRKRTLKGVRKFSPPKKLPPLSDVPGWIRSLQVEGEFTSGLPDVDALIAAFTGAFPEVRVQPVVASDPELHLHVRMGLRLLRIIRSLFFRSPFPRS